MSPHYLFCVCAALFLCGLKQFSSLEFKDVTTFFLSDLVPNTVNVHVVQPLILLRLTNLCFAEGFRDHMSRSVPEKPPKLCAESKQQMLTAQTRSHTGS